MKIEAHRQFYAEKSGDTEPMREDASSGSGRVYLAVPKPND